jgi:gentisate 1,2-dioxygenase
LTLRDGIYVRAGEGGAYYLAELKKIRPVSDMKDRPLTAEEQGRIDAAVEAKMRADRAAFVDEYHIDYIDPVTGEWKGGAEGAR